MMPTRRRGLRPGAYVEAEAAGIARTLAPAKVNLVLRIGGKRADGFHELVTIFQAVSLADEVEVSVKPRPSEDSISGADNGVDLFVDGPDLGPTEQNLAWRAASEFLRQSGHRGTVSIHLKKHIPAGAGLGGGSSDAAAVLRCLATLMDFTDREALHEIAARLGSDVTFFLGASPTAIGRGRGGAYRGHGGAARVPDGAGASTRSRGNRSRLRGPSPPLALECHPCLYPSSTPWSHGATCSMDWLSTTSRLPSPRSTHLWLYRLLRCGVPVPD